MPGSETKKARDRERMQKKRQMQRMEMVGLKDLIQTLLDNDPNETIDDCGHTVLDMWRHHAKKALAPS